MSNALPCGCCEGTTAETPVAIANRPALSVIEYRSGTWAQFKASMLAALSTAPELEALRTRSDDDFSIALLDAWAVVCDILTYYQERIANESYLRTASELLSVGELGKLIGYKLRAGLAASAPLAFTIDAPRPAPPARNQPASGTPSSVVIPAGTKAQTTPDPGQTPATFETGEPITARAGWNAIGPRLTMPPASIAANASANVRLAGLVSTLKPGDQLLVVSGDSQPPVIGQNAEVQTVAAVEPDPDGGTTLVRFPADTAQQRADPPAQPASTPPSSAVLGDQFASEYVKGVVWADQARLVAFATARGWSLDALEDGINALNRRPAATGGAPVRVYQLGIDASLFGHNAPKWSTLPLDSDTFKRPPDWESQTLDQSSGPQQLDLENVYPVVPGALVVLEDRSYTYLTLPGHTFIGATTKTIARKSFGVTGGAARFLTEAVSFVSTVTDVRVLTRSDFLLSAKLTRATLAGWPSNADQFGMRTTRVLAQTAELTVADTVLENEVTGGSLTLDGAYLSLSVGQLVAVTGFRADRQGETASEVVAIASLQLVDGYTVATFTPDLTGRYVRATVTIDANVAPATHGETTTEILGSGDASTTFQRFPLKQSPLTYVSAATASGSASTLAVYVNGRVWQQVDWLYGYGPTDRVYTVVAGADRKTYVQFGDGVTGARPDSGVNNISATYRYGIGNAGTARSGQISTLLTRPLGVKGATNPVASTGAADPETVAQARTNAPISIKALDRVVSLEDVADFAAASAGIAKASVNWIWDGSRFVACVTVAGRAGAAVVPGSDQFRNLQQALLANGDGTLPVTLSSHVPVTFRVAATIKPDPDLVGADVLAAVKAALVDTFSFDRRAFGQPVFASEVVTCIQDVPGVVSTTLDAFDYTREAPAASIGSVLLAWERLRSGGLFASELGIRRPLPLRRRPVQDALPASSPTVGPAGLRGAELLTLEPGTLPDVGVA